MTQVATSRTLEKTTGRASQAVRRTWIDLQNRTFDDLRGEQSRVGNRYNLVVVAMDDERRNVELLEVFGQVRLGESLDAVIGPFETNGHRPEPERIANTL